MRKLSLIHISIGKSAENDLVLSDNKAISRKHAVIYKQNGNFVIVDQRSTNHSFLKGEMLEPVSYTHLAQRMLNCHGKS